MKIISKFHDYYDGVQGIAFDDELVYLRKYRTILLKELIKQDDLRIGNRKFSNGYSVRIKNGRIKGYSEKIIGFCGEIYYLFEIYYILTNEGIVQKRSAFSQEQLNEILIELELKSPKSEELISFSEHYKKMWSVIYSDSRHLQALRDIFTRENTPIFVIKEDTYDLHWLDENNSRGYNELIVEINPCLKEYDFQKEVDSFNCYQSISMYIGGVLTKPDAPILLVSDEIKTLQHGFDEFSFKTIKGDKKPRGLNRGKKK